MNMQEAVVVIPLYKNELTDYEKFSLQKALNTFSKYSICFVCPHGITAPVVGKQFQVLHFDAKYFKGLRGYNQLLLSSEFYQSFLDYKFMLIYQLDALVFSDELEYWCSLDYDYCGAPWNKRWKKRYYNFYGMLTTEVGNGGFSLRKTEVFYKMSKRIRTFKHLIRFGEDIFWCTYGRLIYSGLKIADYKTAMRFAFESQPEKLYGANNYKLPFGCHAFEKNSPSFWRKMIADLPQ